MPDRRIAGREEGLPAVGRAGLEEAHSPLEEGPGRMGRAGVPPVAFSSARILPGLELPGDQLQVATDDLLLAQLARPELFGHVAG